MADDQNQTVDIESYNEEDDDAVPSTSRDTVFEGLPSKELRGHGLSRRRISSQGRRSSTQRETAFGGPDDYLSPEFDMGSFDDLDLEDGGNPIQAERNNAKLRNLPKPLSMKRSLKARGTVGTTKRLKQLSCWKMLKLRLAMWFYLVKARIRDWFRSLELWRGHMKEIEGHFGNGVVSYFIFLKSLLFLNLVIFFIEFTFVTVPQLVYSEGHLEAVIANITNGTKCSAAIGSTSTPSRSAADHILDFFTGQGYINTTLMFYSNYDGYTFKHDSFNYNMPLAYLLVGFAYFVCSLLMMVKNLSQGFTDSVIESGGLFYSYCNKVFASWDYCIVSESASNLKCLHVYQDLQSELSEEERREKIRNRTRKEKCRIYTLRTVITVIVLGILGGSVYLIIKAVEVSTDPSFTREGNSVKVILARWASSLTITGLNLALPTFFELLTEVEEWSPRVEVAISLWRAVLLKLASLAVLIITLYTTFNSHTCQQCWENQLGAQMFNLIWVDLVANVAATVVVETGRKYVFRHMSLGCGFGKKIGMQEFQIPKNVLEIVYGQALVWIGTFFSPLIPVLGFLKLIIMFYVKKISLMFNCKPASKPYQGARSNYFFTLLLLLTFLLCLVGVGWGITRIHPSCCGPYANLQCDTSKRMLDVVKETIDDWPSWIRSVRDFVQTPSFIIPLFVIICLLLYYFRAMTVAHERMIELLKNQLVMEGRDKHFLMERFLLASRQERARRQRPSE